MKKQVKTDIYSEEDIKIIIRLKNEYKDFKAEELLNKKRLSIFELD